MRSPLPPIAVFDLDGTLADTAPDLIGTLNHLLKGEGLPALPLAEARDMIGAGAKALIERGVAAAGRARLEPRHLDALYSAFLDHYAAHICVGTALYPGVTEALDRLIGRGFLLAVCTNKVEAHARLLLAALGIQDRFAAISGKDSFAFSKPDPRHLTATIALAGGDPERAVMVGDSRTDIATAQAAGIPSIAVPFGYSDVPVHSLRPSLVVEHFATLPEAVERLVPSAPLRRRAAC